MKLPTNYPRKNHMYIQFNVCKEKIIKISNCLCLIAILVMGKALVCGIVISEFEFQPRYFVHFRTNTHGEVMNSLVLPGME